MPLRQRIHRRTYPLRISSMALSGLVVAASMAQHGAGTGLWVFVLVSALLWPHLAFWHAQRHRDAYRAEHINLAIDALIVGAWIPLMHFSVLPTVAILAISIADRNYAGVRQVWQRALPTTLLAMALASLLLRPTPHWSAGTLVQLSLLPLILVHSVFSSWSTRKLVRKLAKQNVRLQVLGRIDPLTTLYSRDYWWQKARMSLRDFRVRKQPACLLVIDIDHFKQVNDRYGHTVGDEVLQSIGLTIRKCLRPHDAAGRYGGDEFAVLCQHATLEDACTVAVRIRQQIGMLRVRSHPQLRVSASIGVASAHANFQSVKDWINAADSALYGAKDGGRDRVIPAPADGQAAPRRQSPASMPSSRPAPLDTAATPAAAQQREKDDAKV